MKKLFVCWLTKFCGSIVRLSSARYQLALLLLCPQFMPGADSAPLPVSEVVEAALLAENWPAVTAQLIGVETNGAPAGLRLIKGHACLALNENNQSFSLFLSPTSRTDFVAYADWALSFAERNSENATAYYFRGDALARKTNWSEAITSFDRALTLNPKHALTLNARGVVFAQQGKVAPAKKDFVEAAACSGGSLADAYDNAGYLWIQRKDGAKGALEAFQKALVKSPQFALALHGKGCIELVTGDQSAAVDDFVSAHANGGPALPLLVGNEVRYAMQAMGNGPTNFLAELQKAGTSLSAHGSLDKSSPFGFKAEGDVSLGFKNDKVAGAYAHVKIQDGNWPFLPLYGLAYRIGDSSELDRKP